MEVNIELNEEVAREFLETEYKGELLDYSLYMTDFKISYPVSANYKDDTIANVVKSATNVFEIDNTNKVAKEFKDKLSKDTIVIDACKNSIEIKMYLDNKPSMTGDVVIDEDEISWEINGSLPMTTDELRNILNNTIHYLLKPKTVKEISTKVDKHRKKGKKGRKSKNAKKYVYKNIVVNRVAEKENNSETRPYTRETPAWRVRGHWRLYKDKGGETKKKVWIKPHIKYAKVDIDKNMAEIIKPYRITRVDKEEN